MSNPVEHASNTGIGGPGFVALQVRDVAAAADFYEQKVGLKRDRSAGIPRSGRVSDHAHPLRGYPGTCGSGPGQSAHAWPRHRHLVQSG